MAKIEIMRFQRETKHRGVILDGAALDAVTEAATRLSPDTAEIKRALNTCWQKLNGRPRQVFDLYYFHSLKTSHIAQSLSLTRNAGFLALHRARIVPRRCMEHTLGWEGGLP